MRTAPIMKTLGRATLFALRFSCPAQPVLTDCMKIALCRDRCLRLSEQRSPPSGARP